MPGLYVSELFFCSSFLNSRLSRCNWPRLPPLLHFDTDLEDLPFDAGAFGRFKIENPCLFLLWLMFYYYRQREKRISYLKVIILFIQAIYDSIIVIKNHANYEFDADYRICLPFFCFPVGGGVAWEGNQAEREIRRWTNRWRNSKWRGGFFVRLFAFIMTVMAGWHRHLFRLDGVLLEPLFFRKFYVRILAAANEIHSNVLLQLWQPSKSSKPYDCAYVHRWQQAGLKSAYLFTTHLCLTVYCISCNAWVYVTHTSCGS